MPVLALITGNWKAIAIAGLMVAIFASGWHVKGALDAGQRLKEQTAAIAAQAKQQSALNAKSTALETQLASLRQSNRRINALLDNELKHPGYSCPVPVNGLQLLRETVAGKPAS